MVGSRPVSVWNEMLYKFCLGPTSIEGFAFDGCNEKNIKLISSRQKCRRTQQSLSQRVSHTILHKAATP
jgi:hypothetical protein